LACGWKLFAICFIIAESLFITQKITLIKSLLVDI